MAVQNKLSPLKDKKVWLAGHTGLVGSSLQTRLKKEECEIFTAASDDLDLRDQRLTLEWASEIKPDVIIATAAKVGGIGANIQSPFDFIFDNLMINSNLINCAKTLRVSQFIFLGSNCMYPADGKQPYEETTLFSGSSEASNRYYAEAKRSSILMLEALRKQHKLNTQIIIPTSLYGPNDNFSLTEGHVVPSLLLKIHNAKKDNDKNVVLWGTGNSTRELMYVDDLSDGIIFTIKNHTLPEPINIGTGNEISIKKLAMKIKHVVGFKGDIIFDSEKPDGARRKVLNSKKINSLGWKSKTDLDAGLRLTYHWLKNRLENKQKIRGVL